MLQDPPSRLELAYLILSEETSLVCRYQGIRQTHVIETILFDVEAETRGDYRGPRKKPGTLKGFGSEERFLSGQITEAQFRDDVRKVANRVVKRYKRLPPHLTEFDATANGTSPAAAAEAREAIELATTVALEAIDDLGPRAREACRRFLHESADLPSKRVRQLWRDAIRARCDKLALGARPDRAGLYRELAVHLDETKQRGSTKFQTFLRSTQEGMKYSDRLRARIAENLKLRKKAE